MSRHRRQPRSVSSCTNRPPLRSDSIRPKLVEFVATCLIELRPERDQVGVGHRPRLGHQDEKDSSLGTGQVAGVTLTACQRSG